MVYLIYFSDALGMIHIEPEPPATANDSCHMSRDIVWLSGGGDEGDLPTLVPLLSELSLGRMRMESKNDSTLICNTVCDAVCTLQFLRLLELHIPLRANLLYHISIMPHLSKLVVMITAKILTQALLANSSARL